MEIGPCAYCGEATTNQDAYGLACVDCLKFFVAHEIVIQGMGEVVAPQKET